MIKEDKQKICDALLEVFKLTRERDNIVSIKYEKDTSELISGDGRHIEVYGEFVNVLYVSGLLQQINVTADSGMALIRDVMEQIRY